LFDPPHLRPYLDRIEGTLVPDAVARLAGFRSKQFDVVHTLQGGANKPEADQLTFTLSESGDQPQNQSQENPLTEAAAAFMAQQEEDRAARTKPLPELLTTDHGRQSTTEQELSGHALTRPKKWKKAS